LETDPKGQVRFNGWLRFDERADIKYFQKVVGIVIWSQIYGWLVKSVDMQKTSKSIELLLIEDNPEDMFLTKRMLEKAEHTSFHISYADSLAKGIERAAQSALDVILSDLNLPDSPDVETFFRLKLQVPEIPIVVLSGFADEAMSLKAVREGAQDYLIKGQINNIVLERSLLYAIERKRAEETIKKLAYHDPLTGLPSRLLLSDRFAMAAADSQRNNRKTALIMLDLDHFKDINDNYGHDAGDEMLKEVSDRLVGILRQTDTVCRNGGDEFILLIPEINTKEMIDEIAQRILVAIGKPFNLHGVEKRISASLGIATNPENGNSLEILIKHADVAMYEVKKTGRNHYLYYATDQKSSTAVD
jgi:diguanylate cyclase (GGDEF)-like protein